MSSVSHTDRAHFTRTTTIEYDRNELPEYASNHSNRAGVATRVRLSYDYQFQSGKWTGRATVFWRWVLASRDLGKEERRDTWPRAPWVLELIEKHHPTSTIAFKENN